MLCLERRDIVFILFNNNKPQEVQRERERERERKEGPGCSWPSIRWRALYLHSPFGLVARLVAQGGSDFGPCRGSGSPRSVRVFLCFM